MQRKILTILTLLMIVPFVVGCSNVSTTQTTTAGTSYDYDDFSSQEITDPDLQLSQPETDYYIYFYGNYCLSCQEIKQEALGLIVGLEIDKVYLAEASKYSDINENIGIEHTPALAHIVNNEMTDSWEGGASVLEALRLLA